MKKILIILALIFSLNTFSQDCVMPVSILLDEEFTNVPEAATNVLYESLNRIATENGLTTESLTSPFVLTVHCDVLDKSNIAGPPIKTIYNLGITLYIADTYTQKKYSTAYITLNGVGSGEVKSYINAFRQINAKNSEIRNLIERGKQKMIAYYDTQYSNIIKEAKRLVSLQKHEEALAMVLAIPTCSTGGKEATDFGVKLYEKHLDRMNLYLLNHAKAQWAATQTNESANEVCAMLAQIDPDATCYEEAGNLMKEIKKQIRNDIDFEMREKYNNKVELEKERISAARAVGVAYGNNQKETTTNLMWLK